MPARDKPSGSVFTISPGRPFLDGIAAAILAGDLPRADGKAPDLLDLPGYTILLPTRRATRALQDAFLRVSGGKAMLLPKIRPIAEGQEDLSLLAGLAAPDSLGGAHDTPAAVSEIERRLVLTELVLRWSEAMRSTGADNGQLSPYAAAGASSPAQAAALAAELSRLMDMIETEGVDLGRLEHLVPEHLSEHWQQTLRFLNIVHQWWPTHLAERGLLSPADRRNQVVLAEARRLAGAPPTGPMIVAGVTGSIPATAELMRVVAGLDNGAIVLPALDHCLDAAGWDAIRAGETADGHPEHAQFGLQKLLSALDIDRSQVGELPGAAVSTAQRCRAEVVAEALRPSSTTDRWRSYIVGADKAAVADAFAGVSHIEAPTAADEAEAIALIMREAAESKDRTAALVSPDRLLARRVATRLEAWGIRVDDSAGRPFAKTVTGAFMDLVIEAQRSAFAPAPLMALLKHPLTRLGLSASAARRAARALEIAVFRGIYLGRGLEDVGAALDQARASLGSSQRSSKAAQRLWTGDWDLAHDLVTRLKAAFAPLDAIFSADGDRHGLADLIRAHVTAAEAVAQVPDDEDSGQLWRGEAGQTASLLFASLLDPAIRAPAVTARDYADLYRGLVGGETVRPHVPVHPRLSIWGPFEARLQRPDIVILGSLNEGTWPEAADPGPWLNRPMRRQLGLPLPEERIGQAAHDFAGLLGCDTVYLTRAQKVDGAPTVASRWVLRLTALLAGLGLGPVLAPTQPWLGWARARDRIEKKVPIKPPAPRPALALRPRKLSVSDVETWIGNPYAIFAGRILRLEPLPPLGQQPDAALRGAIVHEALGRFAARFPRELPDDPAGELMQSVRGVLESYAASPRVMAFWLPRFARFADWFARTEPARRGAIMETKAEVVGQIVLDLPGGPFMLTARADRIDVGERDIAITDYKSGANLDNLARAAVRGEAPQLPLEAAIAAEAGFAGVAERRVGSMRYIATAGGEPPGKEFPLRTDDAAALGSTARDGLISLIALYDQLATPYSALRRARFSYDFDAYAHLARVAEWGSGEGGDSDG